MLNPKFDYGSAVRVITNIRNDGSVPGSRKGELLMRRGSEGYVRQAGFYLQDQVVYQVQFMERGIVLGCREHELQAATEQWIDNQFEYGDAVCLRMALRYEGQLLARPQDRVQVLAVLRGDQQIDYRIQCGEHELVVPERALSALEGQTNVA